MAKLINPYFFKPQEVFYDFLNEILFLHEIAMKKLSNSIFVSLKQGPLTYGLWPETGPWALGQPAAEMAAGAHMHGHAFPPLTLAPTAPFVHACKHKRGR